MKIGVKTFNDENFLKHFENTSDFFEIMAIQKNDYSFLKNFSLPIIIHAEHHEFGVNPADISKKEENLKSLNFARKIADMANSKKIIVHPGFIEKGNSNYSLKNAINFFSEINDNRILIENLSASRDSKIIQLCQTPYQIKKFMKKTSKEFCFDVNHAIEAMKKFNGRYIFIKRYLKLKPMHYHIGGQKIAELLKSHLCFAKSEIDLKKILRYYPDDAEITLETGIDIKEVEKDIEIIRDILKDLGK